MPVRSICERQNIKFQTKMKKKQTRMSDFCPECINSTTGNWMNDIHSRVLQLELYDKYEK
jgi:hypothetical protein